VEAHVLRFWETEFPALSPLKGRNGQRLYRPGDIELILEIRKLLYEDGYKIEGARKHMGMSAPSAAAKKKRAPEIKSQASVNVPKPANPSTPEALPLFECVSDEAETSGRADFNDENIVNFKKRVQMELENILTLLDRE
jgi:DNA-binding transcriptional MerR regulator